MGGLHIFVHWGISLTFSVHATEGGGSVLGTQHTYTLGIVSVPMSVFGHLVLCIWWCRLAPLYSLRVCLPLLRPVTCCRL